ncbi:hypothetical protein PCE1_003278 [Barthelona sp. PCE]
MQPPTQKDDQESTNRFAQCTDDELFADLSLLWSFLEWLADVNWPVAGSIYSRLNKIEERNQFKLVPHIITILQGTDDCWKYSIMSQLTLRGVWTHPDVTKILSDMAQIVNEEELHIEAGCLLFSYEPDPTPTQTRQQTYFKCIEAYLNQYTELYSITCINADMFYEMFLQANISKSFNLGEVSMHRGHFECVYKRRMNGLVSVEGFPEEYGALLTGEYENCMFTDSTCTVLK